jgi:hypothetical protein
LSIERFDVVLEELFIMLFLPLLNKGWGIAGLVLFKQRTVRLDFHIFSCELGSPRISKPIPNTVAICMTVIMGNVINNMVDIVIDNGNIFIKRFQIF